MLGFSRLEKKEYNIAFIITELGRFRYHDFVNLLIKNYPSVRVHFILAPSLISWNNTYKNKAEKELTISELLKSNHNKLFSTFSHNCVYHIINYDTVSNNFYENIKSEFKKIFNSLYGKSYVFFSDLDLSKSLNKSELKDNIKLIYTSYWGFCLLKNDSKWFIVYPQLVDYYAVIVHHEIDKKYLLKPIQDKDIKKKIDNVVKIIDLPIIRNKKYLQYKKNSYIIIILHWTKSFSKAEQYLDSLRELVQKYPSEKFLIRLHPLFLRNKEHKQTNINEDPNIQLSPFLSNEFVNKFVNSFQSIANVIFSLEESLTEILLDSKMLIIDGKTMISDYLLSEKPIILLNNLEKPASDVFNELFTIIKPGIYDVYNGKDLLQVFDDLICGKDSKHQIRQQISNKLFFTKIDSKLFDLLGIDEK